MTLLEVIQKSADFLEQKGIDSPRLQAELLLAHVLKIRRLDLYLRFEQEINGEPLDAYRSAIKRRSQREPLQHIVGSVSFCGYELAVGPQALIPRPETELLAECAWKFLKGKPAPHVLDIGTGTGCLALSIALETPTAKVTAVDISPEALGLAKSNADLLDVTERLSFHLGDCFAPVPAGAKFDVIVSNPPYIPHQEIETLQPEVRDHDPRPALDGGEDGLNFYRLLAEQAGAWLAEGGRLMAEFGDGQETVIAEILQANGWNVDDIHDDMAGTPRYFVASRA